MVLVIQKKARSGASSKRLAQVNGRVVCCEVGREGVRTAAASPPGLQQLSLTGGAFQLSDAMSSCRWQLREAVGAWR